MHEVFEKASILGEAIQRSEEFRAMRQAEEAVMRDPGTATIYSEFMTRRTQVQEALSQENPDHAALAEQSEALQSMQEALGLMPLIQQMTRARAEFTTMMEQVNQVLRFLVTGDMGEEESGCGGKCGGCGGACGKHSIQ